jgi:hypothetical protein
MGSNRGRLSPRPNAEVPVRMMLAVTLVVSMLGLIAFASSCSVGVDIGPTQELAVDEPLGSAAVTDVEIGMGAGTLSLGPGATGLASGVIRYNVDAWKPTVERTDKKLSIEQGKKGGLEAIGGDIVNEWRLQMGNAPMRLQVSAGAYEGTYDLGGLTLQGLTIKDGAARSEVRFGSPNPGQMQRFLYETGASTVNLTSLANANFRIFEFNGGAGSYTMDFSGRLRTDGTVRVKAGVGSVRIVVPAETAAQVTVKGSLTDVSLEGDWTTAGKTSSTPAAKTGGQDKTLFIEVDMSVGTLELVTR